MNGGAKTMDSRLSEIATMNITIDSSSATSLYTQLYRQIRSMVLSGQLAPATRLPSTRALGAALGLSRNTVLAAFDQLRAEGYLVAQTGSGTFVTSELPDDLPVLPLKPRSALGLARTKRTLSDLGTVLATTPVSTQPHPEKPRAFRAGLPDVDSFPIKLWSRLMSNRLRKLPTDLLEYPDAAGYWPLREAIAKYLNESRGVSCGPEQVLIVNGSQQALNLAARLLLNEGDVACVEDPGYLGAHGALKGSGTTLVPVPVDAQGLSVDAGRAKAPQARLISVTPSRHYPLGVTMSLTRRLELLDWARRADAWVLEDDYDSEYRYKGLPLAAMQGLDTDGRVIYVGTFSKVMFPSLRLGYMVVPADLVSAFASARALLDGGSSSIEQAVMADFIVEGHLARHVRKMRVLYARKQAVLVEAVKQHFNGLIDIHAEEAGMHLVGWLPERVDDRRVSRLVAAQGVEAQPLLAYSIEWAGRGGLLLGYTWPNADEIRDGVSRMAVALKNLRW